MLRFTVPNMACGGCTKGVTRAIQSVDADARVETDTAQREVRVESAKACEAALLAAHQSAGYPAERRLEPVG
jgi:copper chaperone